MRFFLGLVLASFALNTNAPAESLENAQKRAKTHHLKQKKYAASSKKKAPKKRKPASKKMTVLQEVENKIKASKFLSVDFQQNVYRDLRKRNRISLGTAFFMKPNSFRWILKKPIKNEWIYNGKDLVNINPEEKKGTRYQSEAAQAKELKQIVNMVINIKYLLKNYTLEKSFKKKNIAHLELKPKSANQIEMATLQFDLKKGFIKSIKLDYVGADHTTFKFSNPTNKKILSSVFTSPKGYKIIEGM